MKLIRFFMPRLEYILFAAIFWGIAATGPNLLNSDGDLPRHILVGNLIRTTGEIHLTDIFSFRTIGFPSIPHEWLAQVIISAIYSISGLSGIVFFTASIVTVTWIILYYEAQNRSGSLIASLLFIALGVSTSLIHVLPRPHLFSHFFIALWVLILEQLRTGKSNRWWLLPVIMLAWVNLHGMFVMGIGIWAIYLVGEGFSTPVTDWRKSPQIRALLMGGLPALFATFFSPSGFAIWGTILELGGNSYLKSRIPEYQAPNFQTTETWPFILILLLCLLSFSRSKNQTPWTQIFLVCAFTAFGLYVSRMLPLFAIVVAPIAAEAFANWIKQDPGSSRIPAIESNLKVINDNSNGLVWVIITVLAIGILFSRNIPIDVQGKGNHFDPEFFPVQAVNWLETHPQKGHVFNEFDWGGYLLYRLWPQYQIFMDGHTHIYGEKLTREYEQVILLNKDWEAILEKNQVTWALVRTRAPIAKALEDKKWQVAYQDDTAIILLKP